jgi:hypothetical protein
VAIAESRAAADTRHRIPYPNARPRRIALVGLGARGAAIATTVDAAALAHVVVVPEPSGAVAPGAAQDMLRSIADGADALARAFEGVDMIYAVVAAGDDAAHAPTLARIARHRGVMLTGIIIDDGAVRDERGLDVMRRACDTLVVTADAGDVAGMLAALGTQGS